MVSMFAHILSSLSSLSKTVKGYRRLPDYYVILQKRGKPVLPVKVGKTHDSDEE
jgi:hypothetical protein